MDGCESRKRPSSESKGSSHGKFLTLVELPQSKLISTPRMGSSDSYYLQVHQRGDPEALELRDGDRQRYNGRGFQKALNNISTVLGPKIIGLDSIEQGRIEPSYSLKQ